MEWSNRRSFVHKHPIDGYITSNWLLKIVVHGQQFQHGTCHHLSEVVSTYTLYSKHHPNCNTQLLTGKTKQHGHSKCIKQWCFEEGNSINLFVHVFFLHVKNPCGANFMLCRTEMKRVQIPERMFLDHKPKNHQRFMLELSGNKIGEKRMIRNYVRVHWRVLPLIPKSCLVHYVRSLQFQKLYTVSIWSSNKRYFVSLDLTSETISSYIILLLGKLQNNNSQKKIRNPNWGYFEEKNLSQQHIKKNLPIAEHRQFVLLSSLTSWNFYHHGDRQPTPRPNVYTSPQK